MKKLITCFLLINASLTFAQTIFQSNLSSWSGGNPTDWMTTARTDIASSKVVEQTTGVTYGTSSASLINTSSNHKRFATGPIPVTGGDSYDIEIWLACSTSGEIRTGWYDATNGVYNPTYNSYIDAAAVSAANLVKVTQTVTLPATCNNAEFILSLKNTDPTLATLDIGIIIDSVAISKTIATGVSPDPTQKNSIAAYPNPASNHISFVVTENTATINLYDITGKRLKTISTNKYNSDTPINIDLNTFSEGVYFYKALDINDKTIATKKFVIVK